MESNLNSSDPYKRAQAILNLSDAMVLETVDKANAYLDFFLERLSDQLSVGGALIGILRIVREAEMQNLEKIASTIIQELNFCSLPQSDRFKILQIYSFSRCKSKLSRDYVQGFLHLVDGEKDPRCLLLALKIIKGIMQSFDCVGLEEDIFDWTFAYFPITFKEKATDPSIVTQSDLRNALRDCMTVDLVGMGQFVIPFLMEKMESSLGLAKRDAMLFLGYASRIYHQDLFNKILPKLWALLKEEIMRPDNKENSLVALDTMRDVLRYISVVQVYSNCHALKPWENMVELVMIQVMDSLQDFHHNLVIYTEEIFLKLATSSKMVYDFVLSKYGEKLLEKFNQETSTPRKVVFCGFLFNLVKAARIVKQNLKSSDNILQSLKNPLLDSFILGAAFSTDYSQLRYYCLAGLSEMILADGILSNEEINNAIIQLRITMMEDCDDKNRALARQTLREVGGIFPANLLDNCADIVLDMISKGVIICEDSALYPAFVTIFMEDSLFTTAISFLGKMVIKVFQRERENSLEGLLNLALKLIENRIEYQINQGMDNIIHKCSDLLLLPIIDAAFESGDRLVIDEMMVFECITAIIMRNLNSKDQVAILDLYFSNLPSFIFDSFICLPLFALLGSARPEVANDVNFSKLFLEIIDAKISSDMIKRYSWKCAASIINKFEIDHQKLESVVSQLKGKISDTSTSVNTRLEGVLLYAWISKAVILNPRLNPIDGMAMLLDILLIHNDLNIGHIAPEAIEIIISEDPQGYLSKESFCRISVLHRQKVFNYCLPKISEGFQCSLNGTFLFINFEDNNQYYLITISHMLRTIPKSILLREASKLFPFIIQSIDSADPLLTLTALDLLFNLIGDSPKLTHEQISSILPILAKKIVFHGELNSLRVRISACNCLSIIPTYIEYSAIYPYKATITNKLAIACDDHKRLVRNAAAKARNVWLIRR